MVKAIAIIILTKDEPRYLRLTVKSIINRTKYPFKLYIVDNNSYLKKQKNILKIFSDANINIIYNDKNEWLLGFNNAVKLIQQDHSLNQDYLVLTDGDIITPVSKNGLCWLEYLKNKMDKNIAIGKIGLSLDLGLLKKNSKFKKTYEIETQYMNGPKIDDLIIAPVDTTIAMYRADLYIIGNFEIIPGHASLVKPHYYIFRTNTNYKAKHLGWRNYENPNKEQLEDKIICFTKYAAYIDPIVLDRVSLKIKYFYKFGRYIFKSYWSLKVIYYWIKYILKKFPRDLNEIQSKYR